MMDKPRLAMISTSIRRDLQDPLRFFTEIDIIHFYRNAFHDLESNELTGTRRYGGPLDLYQKLALAKPDIIQGVEPFGLKPLPNILAGWAHARRHKIPLVVVSLENRPITAKYGRLGGATLKRFLAPYFQDASLLIYLNDGTKRNFDYCGAPSERMQRLMYGTWGIDTSEFTPEGSRYQDPDYDRYILFVGRLIQAKGVFYLLSAFADLSKELSDIGLILIGDGDDRVRLEQSAKQLGIGERVRFLGTVLNHELPPYFRGASVFALPSLTTRGWEEQVGMTNIQAMACGTPIISTHSGAIPEYVQDGLTGVLVPENDVESLKDALANILGNSELAQNLASAGHRYALAHYDAAQNIRVVERNLLSLIPARVSSLLEVKAGG